MDITATNFLEAFPIVQASITEADFISIDTELTGLTSDVPPKDSFFEDPQERYSRLKSSFLIVQFGLSTFKKVNGKWVAKPFNFLLFPSQYTRDSSDTRFLSQASCLRFLSSVGFDFNKLFKEGLGFMPKQKAQAERIKLQERRNRETMQIDEKDKPFLAETLSNIREWFDRAVDLKSLKLPSCNAFQRLILFQQIPKAFPNVIVENEKSSPGSGRSSGNKSLIVTRITAEEREEFDRKKAQEEENELHLALGFSKVLEIITSSKVPVVGHNMILDLINSVNQFNGPLPESLKEFKSKTISMFPRVYDTKYIVTTNEEMNSIFRDSALETLSNGIKNKPFNPPQIELANGFERYNDGNNWHEAGFDSFATGKVFISLCLHLIMLAGKEEEEANFMNSQIVHSLENKICITRSDFPFINLVGDDPVPNRDSVFHLSNFPIKWKTSDIKAAFAAFGDIQVRWVDDSNAFIILLDPSKSELLLTTFTKSQEELASSSPSTSTSTSTTPSTRPLVLVPFAEYKLSHSLLAQPR